MRCAYFVTKVADLYNRPGEHQGDRRDQRSRHLSRVPPGGLPGPVAVRRQSALRHGCRGRWRLPPRPVQDRPEDPRGAVLCFSAHSGVWGVGDRAVSRRQPYRGDVDLFAVYSPDTRQVYVLEVDQVPVTDVWMRLEPARNNQRARIRHAEEHTLEAWAARMGATQFSMGSPP